MKLSTPVDKWSDQFKGIRFKMKNKIPLNVSAVPPVTIDNLVWYFEDGSVMDSTSQFLYSFSINPILSYTNVSSYLRRLNFDYKIEFFQTQKRVLKFLLPTQVALVICTSRLK